MLRFLASASAAILIIAMPAAASARDRPLTVQRDGTKVSIENRSISRSGDLVEAMIRFDPPTGTGWTTFVSVKCDAGSIYAARLPADAGSYSIDPKLGTYRAIRPASVGQQIAARLCPRPTPDISLAAIGGGPDVNMPFAPR